MTDIGSFLQESSNCDATRASSFIEARVASQLLLSWRKTVDCHVISLGIKAKSAMKGLKYRMTGFTLKVEVLAVNWVEVDSGSAYLQISGNYG